jgi:UDP-N-acetylmuramate dehydrogenase
MESGTEKSKDFFSKINGRVAFEESMAKHTSFKVGGPADIFVEPFAVQDAVDVVRYARDQSIPLFILGGGTNILVTDRGIRGVVLSFAQVKSEINTYYNGENKAELEIEAGAGLKTAKLCSFAKKNNITGLAFAAGIPGTIGGAVNVNAGTAEGSMGDIVKAISIITPDSQIRELSKSELKFSYRMLDWKKSGYDDDEGMAPVILSVRLQLKKSTTQVAANKIGDLNKKRKESQPLDLPSAGCFFRNPPDADSAGKLIDLAGLKGTRRGNAEISTRHANFIVNRGGASAADILWLRDLIKTTVKKKFGIELVSEVKVIGC